MNTLVASLLNHLKSGTPVVLASVITRNGSAPRTAGAKMLVLPGGEIEGTIGGGQLEGRSIETAMTVHQTHLPVIREFFMTGKDAASSDMICGGNQEVLLEYLDPGNVDLIAALEEILQNTKSRRSAWWITELPDHGTKTKQVRHILVKQDGQAIQIGQDAQINETPLAIQMDDNVAGPFLSIGSELFRLAEIRETRMINAFGHRFCIDPLDMYGTVYIFGCGHVSQKLAALTRTIGFRTVVLDDRPEYANPERFPAVDEIIVLDSFQDCFNQIELDPSSYIVIVTRGHLDDQVVLSQALRTDAVYIGMIGSRRKCETIYKALLEEGFTQQDIHRVHGPIGLAIEAESPEEIAVSIVGELIQERARLLKRK